MARPIDPDARRHVVSTRVGDERKAWLALWFPGDKVSAQLDALMDRAEQFWENGPDAPPRPPTPGKVRQSPAINKRAAKHGMTRAEYINACSAAYEEAKE